MPQQLLLNICNGSAVGEDRLNRNHQSLVWKFLPFCTIFIILYYIIYINFFQSFYLYNFTFIYFIIIIILFIHHLTLSSYIIIDHFIHSLTNLGAFWVRESTAAKTIPLRRVLSVAYSVCFPSEHKFRNICNINLS